MASQNMIEINDDNFNTLVEDAAQPVLVDFWAEWCMPCKALTPVLEELATEYKGRIVFGKVNVDECRVVPSQFGIRGIPTLILFDGKSAKGQLVGNQPKDRIRQLLDAHIRKDA